MLRLVICTHCGKEICYIGGEVKNEPPMLGECFNCIPGYKTTTLTEEVADEFKSAQRGIRAKLK